MTPLSVQQAIAQATQLLSATSSSAKLDAQVLLLHVLQKPRSYLFAWSDSLLTADQQSQFLQLCQQRQAGQPVAHLTGEKEFWSLPLAVNNSTLIPRPDTETLVESALNLHLPEHCRVLDLGTGTGAIALALASEHPHWQITAVDKSAQAVALATKNQQQLGFTNVHIEQSDWFSALTGQEFDLIVSNPPYIDSLDIHLNQGDVKFEPKSALVAADNGMADINHIATKARDFLRLNGVLMFEHGYQQGEAVQNLLEQLGYQQICTIKDLAKNDRVTLAKWFGVHTKGTAR